MRVLIIIDKPNSAIDRLAQSVKKHNPHLKIEILPVHPKRTEPSSIKEASRLMEWADIIDAHYWKSGEVVRLAFPKVFESKPKVLFHFNPYDAENVEVNQRYNAVVVGNETIKSKLPGAILIPYGIDLDFFKFNDDYTLDKVVNMSVARIEGKKGVLEVAKACKDLGYRFNLVGRVSKPDYIREVMKAGGNSIQFIEDATEEKLREVYYCSAIHICNSVDFFESGTLPILENMACGIPVLTRNVGHIPELYNGANMVVREGAQNDIKDLKKNLKEMMENRDWRLKIREKAWDTVKNRDDRRMARQVAKVYNDIYESEKPLFSVIIPTRDNLEAFVDCLVGALQQDYLKFEVVVADSGDTSIEEIINAARQKTDIPIKYVRFPHKNNYTLAEARNRAVIEAEGECLVFCDDRLRMEPNALSVFSVQKQVKTWFWGQKDGVVKGFVENFCCVNRKDLIDGGMFCERMQWYGGMTQEIRQRFEYGRGFNFVLLDEAKAVSVRRSKSKKSRRQDIIEAKLLLSKMYG